jgi:hypothetical protein
MFEPLSVVSTSAMAVSPLKPSDVKEISYSPALLLDARFRPVLVVDSAFSEACEAGFNTYFEEMYHGSTPEDLVFVDRFYSCDEVEREVIESTVVAHQRDGERLPWCAGFVLGWLSALALVQRREACEGLKLLTFLVVRLEAACQLVSR